jgi:hypothetical protein
LGDLGVERNQTTVAASTDPNLDVPTRWRRARGIHSKPTR